MALVHCGVLPDCPFDVVHILGLEFPKITQRITGYGDEQINSEIQGVVHEFDKATHDKILEKLKTKFVRSVGGKRARSFMVSTESKHYKPLDSDRPLGEFVYMRVTDHDPQKKRVFKTVSELEGLNKVQEQQLGAAGDALASQLEKIRFQDAQLADQAAELERLRKLLEDAGPAERSTVEEKPEAKVETKPKKGKSK